MNLFIKNRDLILTPFGYKTELKLKDTDLILTQSGFKSYNKTSLDYYKNCYKISTCFSDVFAPTLTSILGRCSSDFSEDYVSTDCLPEKLNKGDYLYLPKYSYNDKKYIKNFSVKKYSLDGYDFSSVRSDIKYFNILQKHFLNKFVPEFKLDTVKEYYKTEDLNLLYKSLILISSSPILNLPVNSTFMYLVYLSITKRYDIRTTSVIFSEVSKQKAIELDLYFSKIYSSLFKETNTSYNPISKKYTVNSYIFTEIFKSHFDSYSFINSISPALFKTLDSLLGSNEILYVPTMYSALNLQFIYYKYDKLINIFKNTDNTYTIDLNTKDYYITFKDGYLLEIIDKDIIQEEFFTTYFTF